MEDPGPFINGYAVKDTLHIMDGQSRVATLDTGHRLGDTTPALKYILDDHLGNSTGSVDDSGSLISKEEYYPFGETAFGSYGKKRYKFNGKERDEESGLYYYGMRYYNAWTCRFVSVDPLAGKFPHLSSYQFASNDPVNATDLDGAESTKEGGGDGGGGTQSASSTTTKSDGNIETITSMDAKLHGNGDFVIHMVVTTIDRSMAPRKDAISIQMESFRGNVNDTADTQENPVLRAPEMGNYSKGLQGLDRGYSQTFILPSDQANGGKDIVPRNNAVLSPGREQTSATRAETQRFVYDQKLSVI